MGQMKTIRKADWVARPLLAPDGRSYTPGSFREERELLSSGYGFAPVDQPADTAAPDAAAVPAPELEAPVADAPVPDDETPAPAPTPQTTSKAKAARSNGESK
ncbi:hypothetical protein BO226_18890 [Rhodococcus sp. 2G]|uniref:hypothetical protein n=1 Tax=Rhodococcus sp. 2G TaxID=1570939 RepID=UPI000904335D|nr:hypothetical protein [Rhodococcus sp. 2G]APE11010.1 hypothetical protein BO226_18890 [Rhodococcus sp. 2G]